jgi:hypothetical protein
VPHVRRPDSARYVGGLLLWQGAAWLVLAAAGLGVWIAALQDALSQGVSGSDVLWRGGELLAIAVGAGLGAAEVGMACRLRAGPRLLLVLTLGLQGAALAAGLVVIAISVIVAAFVLEVLALNGAFLGRRQQDRPRDSAYRSHWAGPVLGCGLCRLCDE